MRRMLVRVAHTPGSDDTNAQLVTTPVSQRPGISLVRPDRAESRKGGTECSQEELGAETIMEVGRMDHGLEHEPVGVHQQVALASGDLLGPIKAMWATLLGYSSMWQMSPAIMVSR
jgi:hypothetical protein